MKSELQAFIMLPKKNKLNLKDISNKEVYRGNTWRGKFFSAYFDFKNSIENNQFSVVVPKKNILMATQRNKLKRLIYNEISSDLLQNLKLRCIIKVFKDFSREKEVFVVEMKNFKTEVLAQK
ncbi:MAG: hypothetical protein COU63_03620 [Candidatus Pacebacteria bacterium CG10_big_fil_rev_8_21_14_0_10_36_11]|nr:MAG: hypothetical protein AUK08_05010 [Candidatus Pacebacteria bacterium CG2_30_36_39]PIR64550.1 MAG: hypothetical protein COU63_03620 [Candidatus Pacebacteria bacterium CG10_big_fil_rev_8_21_14_0_10_36_11]PJC43250.1 MAG: hypothetical protein CO040_00120 [Candidatus Pacebacteria bacterium CG_4_9_14_0_2_um_filter_36_8]